MKEMLTSSVVEGSAYFVPSYEKLEERENIMVGELKSPRIYKYKYSSKDTYLFTQVKHMDGQPL